MKASTNPLRVESSKASFVTMSLSEPRYCDIQRNERVSFGKSEVFSVKHISPQGAQTARTHSARASGPCSAHAPVETAFPRTDEPEYQMNPLMVDQPSTRNHG